MPRSPLNRGKTALVFGCSVRPDERPEGLLRSPAEIQEFQAGLVVESPIRPTVAHTAVYDTTLEGDPLSLARQLQETRGPQLENALVFHQRP